MVTAFKNYYCVLSYVSYRLKLEYSSDRVKIPFDESFAIDLKVSDTSTHQSVCVDNNAHNFVSRCERTPVKKLICLKLYRLQRKEVKYNEHFRL